MLIIYLFRPNTYGPFHLHFKCNYLVYFILRDLGMTGFSWAKDYNKSGRAPGHLLLPIQVQKRLRKIFFCQISEEEQPGDSHVFLHEVVFLINRRSSVARSTGTFLRRALFSCVAARKQILKGNFSRRTYRRYRKFLELATSPFPIVTNYFSFFVDLRLKLSISDARSTQLC